jgi:NodT family efflux transporter outer membrane factor (OMF) lipoprotein
MAGCASAPYAPPALSAPDRWPAAATAQASTGTQDAWWKRWGDPRLDRLVDRALEQNVDLRVGALKVREARVRAESAARALEPSVSAQVGSTKTRAHKTGDEVRTESWGLAIAYELDLWNRLGSQRSARNFEAQAAEQDQASLRLSLVATLLRTYWQIAYTNQLLANQERSIKGARRVVELVDTQHRYGSASDLEVAEAQATLASAEARRIALQQSLVESRNALALLVDSPLGTPLELPEGLPTSRPPSVEPGLPAELLARRPDLRAAELRLRRLHSDNEAIKASYYPSFPLTAGLGQSSTSLRDAIRNPVMTLGASLVLSATRRGDYRRASDTAKLQQEQAELEFGHSLSRAMTEVDTALTARRHWEQQSALARRALDAAREVERVYSVRYRAGAVPLRTWLDAQESLRVAENSWAENQLNLNVSQVGVVQALGGEPVAGNSPGASGGP